MIENSYKKVPDPTVTLHASPGYHQSVTSNSIVVQLAQIRANCVFIIFFLAMS